MARAQQQGIGAITVWMIVFVFFWLVSTVWLVVLYTGQEELMSENVRLQRANRQLITSEERSSIEVVRNLVDGGPTLVGLLEQARAETARLAVGEPRDGVDVVRTKRDELLGTIVDEGLVDDSGAFADVSLLDGLALLYDSYKIEHELRRTAEERLEELDTEMSRLVQLTAEQKADLDKRAEALGAELASVEASRAAYRSDRDEAVAALEDDFEKRRMQTDADLTGERQRRYAAQQRTGELQLRLAVLEEKYGALGLGPEELGTVRQPDGRILTAVPGDDIVYIDLGENDRLVLGLQFAVYSAAKGIPADGRAKAQIEVVAVFASSSECRITGVADFEPVVEGDWIANPIYDPDRAPSFVVVGGFDLDRDGAVDLGGRGAIEAIITNWGGTVTHELTALTDFVVVGAAPPRPRQSADPTPAQAERTASMQGLRDRYEQMVASANGLSVPVMTQEVFLNFLGHTTRRTGR